MRSIPRSLLLLLVAITSHAQISSFKHVVVIFQENRTPDNLFQGLCSPPYGACAVPPTFMAPYNIQTSNWKTKTGTVNPGPVALANSYDLDHSHHAFNVMCNIVAGNPASCRMNGAASVSCNPKTGTVCPANPALKYVNNAAG